MATDVTLNSPYGTDPAGPSKSCPAGYQAVWNPNYGWVCAETTAREKQNFQQFLDSLGPDGVNIHDTGITPVAGLTLADEVTQIKDFLEHKYHRNYAVIHQAADHGILVTPAARAAQLDQLPNPEVSGSATDYALDQSALDEAAAWAAQYSKQYDLPYRIFRVVYTDASGFTAVDYVVQPKGQAEPTAPGSPYTGQSVDQVGGYTRGVGSTAAAYPPAPGAVPDVAAEAFAEPSAD